MKKILFFLFIFFFLSFLVRPTYAQISSLPKPITGTFWLASFDGFSTKADFSAVMDEMKEAGFDTIISPSLGYTATTGCGSPTESWSYLWSGSPSIVENFLQAAYDKGFGVYVGLENIWDWSCTEQNKTYLINQSMDLANRLKTLSLAKGWGWDDNKLIKGWYIPFETDVPAITTPNWQQIYFYWKDISHTLKQSYPNKKVLISPYMYESNSEDTIYNNIKYVVENTDVDVIAPQDSVGSGKVTSYNTDFNHIRAILKAVKDGNNSFQKNAEAWINVESFSPTQDGGTTWPPANFKTLGWQIRAVTQQDARAKMITWTYFWSLWKNPNYYSTYASQRITLRNDYLTKPIIINAFNWDQYSPPAFVIYSYNIGSPGDLLGVYIHYQNTSGQTKAYKKQGNSFIYNLGISAMEIRVPLADLPGIDISRPIEIALQNKDNKVGYYRSQNPDTLPDPSFPEISFFPTPTPIPPTATPIPLTATPIPPTNTPIPPSPTPLPLPGDLDKNGQVNISDYNILLQNFGNTTCNNVADIDGNCKADIFDYNILVGNFGKTP